MFIALLIITILVGLSFLVYQLTRTHMVYPNSPMVETTRSRNEVNNDLARGDLTSEQRTHIEGESNYLDYIEKLTR